MATNNFFDLVKSALPSDMPPQELMQYAPAKWWQEKPRLASAYALRKCPRLNWEGYLERNPDIKSVRIDPILHFLKHGILEGRKLISWHPLKEVDKSNQPLVSLIIASYNNGIYLEKCLRSAIGQTLKNIEIIVVDDASSDESPAIINRFAVNDPRIRTIYSEKNESTFMSRKKGVLAATGRYIMFMDSDDFLVDNACEIAYKTISGGYDVVLFGINLINMSHNRNSDIKRFNDDINKYTSKEYVNDEIREAIFITRNISWNLWNKIYLREICFHAYNKIGNDFLLGAEDVVAILGIVYYARTLYAIKDRLYNWVIGSGISTSVDKVKNLRYLFQMAKTDTALSNYADDYKLNINLSFLNAYHCKNAINKLLLYVNNEDINDYFMKIADIFGISLVIDSICNLNSKELLGLVKKISNFVIDYKCKYDIYGIYCPIIKKEDISTINIIKSLLNFARCMNKEIILFTVKLPNDGAEFPDWVKVVNINIPGCTGNEIKNHSKRLKAAIGNNSVDIMFYIDIYRPSLVMDIIMLHYCQIPVILNLAQDFKYTFIQPSGIYYDERDAVCVCADATICSSELCESYLKMRGVNAWHISLPASEIARFQLLEPPQKIALLGNLSHPFAQIFQSLQVLKKVIGRMPWVQAIFIGTLGNDTQCNAFYEKVHELGLEGQIIVTGSSEDADSFLRKCGVLLSTSYWDSYALPERMAQAAGLPCVMYDIPIERDMYNESIISVSQGDYEGAADTICDLLSDSKKWRRLSSIAAANARNYTPDIFRKQMSTLVNNFQRLSPYRQFARPEYEAILKYMTFYAGNTVIPNS